MEKEIVIVADFRYDEGVRPRKDMICPTLSSGLGGGGGLSRSVLVIEKWKRSESNKQQNKDI